MKIIKITSLGCPSCIIMNGILDEVSKDYKIDVLEYDYDFDDIEKYNVGKTLPVLIFINDDKEIARLIGEQSKEKIIEIIGD